MRKKPIQNVVPKRVERLNIIINMPLSFSNYQLLMFMLAVWLDFFAMVGAVPFLVVIFKLMITVIIGQKKQGNKNAYSRINNSSQKCTRKGTKTYQKLKNTNNNNNWNMLHSSLYGDIIFNMDILPEHVPRHTYIRPLDVYHPVSLDFYLIQ